MPNLIKYLTGGTEPTALHNSRNNFYFTSSTLPTVTNLIADFYSQPTIKYFKY